jgi:hypothetical protein
MSQHHGCKQKYPLYWKYMIDEDKLTSINYSMDQFMTLQLSESIHYT